jgi:hypothetical protein
MAIPDQREQQETNGERRETAHGRDEIVERFWHVERNDQQRQCKSKHRIAKRFQPRDLNSAQTKPGQITRFR